MPRRLHEERRDRRLPRLRKPRAIAAVSALGRHAHLLAPSASRVAYVGWAGHQNMGDEAILAAYRKAFPSCNLVDASATAPLARLDRLAPWTLFRAAMLGGGTLVGWPGYRRTLEKLFEVDEGLPAFMLGTGVEDPSFYRLNPLLLEALEEVNESGSSGDELFWGELARWRPVLARFRRVAVRGPRSRATLQRVGIDSEVVGDAALLLADDSPAARFREKLLGLNVGVARGLWGTDPGALAEAVVAFAREMRRRGWSIRLVPAWPGDVEHVRDIARRIGGAVEIFPRFLDLEALLAAIRECHVFVGQKLHSVVFASAVYVPAVMLEYHPKCADFHDSLGRSRYTMRTDRVTSDALVAMVDEIAASRDEHQAALLAGVARLRGRLEEAADATRRELAIAR